MPCRHRRQLLHRKWSAVRRVHSCLMHSLTRVLVCAAAKLCPSNTTMKLLLRFEWDAFVSAPAVTWNLNLRSLREFLCQPTAELNVTRATPHFAIAMCTRLLLCSYVCEANASLVPVGNPPQFAQDSQIQQILHVAGNTPRNTRLTFCIIRDALCSFASFLVHCTRSAVCRHYDALFCVFIERR